MMIKEWRASSPVGGDKSKVGHVVQSPFSVPVSEIALMRSSPIKMRTYKNHWSAEWAKALASGEPGSIEQLLEAVHFDWVGGCGCLRGRNRLRWKHTREVLKSINELSKSIEHLHRCNQLVPTHTHARAAWG